MYEYDVRVFVSGRSDDKYRRCRVEAYDAVDAALEAVQQTDSVKLALLAEVRIVKSALSEQFIEKHWPISVVVVHFDAKNLAAYDDYEPDRYDRPVELDPRPWLSR